MAEAAPQTGQSESMEDILQSIKRIIEDDTAEAKPAGADVLDLTQMVKDDGSVAAVAPLSKAPPSAPSQDVVKSIDAMFATEKPAPVPAAASASVPAPVPVPVLKAMESGLVSDQAAQAAADALKPIVESAQKDFSVPYIASPQLRNGNTVEDLVLEALRPMLKGWLDEHLPTIVQKIVEKEVKRIVTFHHD